VIASGLVSLFTHDIEQTLAYGLAPLGATAANRLEQ
jgi:hypothetical protein